MKGHDATLILYRVRAVVGPHWKSLVRQAWMDGNYEQPGLSPWSAELQQIRNSLGPTWLHNMHLKGRYKWHRPLSF